MEPLGVFFYVAVILYGIPLFYAIRVAEPEDQAVILLATGIAVSLLLLLLYFVDDAFPFVGGGGDDEMYFEVSNIHPDSIQSAVGLVGVYAQQPGYGFLMIAIDLLVQGLYWKKASNVMLFVVNALMWYRIGLLTANRQTAVRFFFAVLLATPLMYYFFFLLKDMAIAVLHTALLMWTLDFVFKEKRIHVLLIFLGFVAMALLRLPAVLMCGALVAGVLFFYRHLWLARWREARLNRLVVVALFLAAAGAFYVLVTNAALIQLIGISSQRSLGGEGLSNQLNSYLAKAQGSPLFIAVIYFLVTLNGAYVLTREMSPLIIEGISALPWMYVGLPLFLWACYHFATHWRTMSSRESALYCLLMFITVLFLGQSIVVSDVTRWRMAGMSEMMALAALGWEAMGARRTQLLLIWVAAFSFLLGTYYIVLV